MCLEAELYHLERSPVLAMPGASLIELKSPPVEGHQLGRWPPELLSATCFAAPKAKYGEASST